MKVIRNLPAMAALAVALAIASQARADVISFYLTTTESGSTISQSFAVEVTVTTTAGTAGDYTAATVVFTAPAGKTVDAPIELNINGDYSATSTEGITTDGSEDSFGVMSLETGSAGGHSTITIDLTAEGGNSWASAANVLTPTCPVEVATPSCVVGYNDPSSENKAGNSTGYGTQFSHGLEAEVSSSPQDAGYDPPVVPEPSTLALLGVGLLAFFGVAGRRRKNA